MYDGSGTFAEACRLADEKLQLARLPKFSDEALALLFAEIHASDLRHVAAWNQWLVWDGACWRFDRTMRAFDHAREICRWAASKCEKPSLAMALASAKTVAAVAQLAKSDELVAATVDQWDVDPWLLNTPAGTVDLRTGRSRAHRPDDYITKLTGVAPDPSCPIPVWLKFLDRAFAGDKELIAFMQRTAGYGLPASRWSTRCSSVMERVPMAKAPF